MSTTTRRAGGAAAVFALAWLIAGPSTPPLYDGLGFPDEPYRYVTPPTGYQHTKPPTAAALTQALGPGTDEVLSCGSQEQGPQVVLTAEVVGVIVPAGATTVTLRADPLAPTSEPPDGTIWGNVYRVTASTDRGPARFKPATSQSGFITLRAPTGPPPRPVIEYDSGGGWHQLATDQVGADIYLAPIAGIGDYATVITHTQPATTTPATDSTSPGAQTGPGTATTTTIPPPAAIPIINHGSGTSGLPIVIGVILALFILLIIAVRLARARAIRRSPPGPGK